MKIIRQVSEWMKGFQKSELYPEQQYSGNKMRTDANGDDIVFHPIVSVANNGAQIFCCSALLEN
jgi:hypothetical protein